MEQSIIFKQRSRKKSRQLFIIYCIALLAVAILIGTGAFGILDFINSSKNGRAPGLILGVVLLAPLPFLIKFTKRNIEITFKQDKIVIKDQKEINIPIGHVESLKINDPRMNTVSLHSSTEELYCFDTGDGAESLKQVSDSILSMGQFKKSIRKKKIMGGEMDLIEYRQVRG